MGGGGEVKLWGVRILTHGGEVLPPMEKSLGGSFRKMPPPMEQTHGGEVELTNLPSPPWWGDRKTRTKLLPPHGGGEVTLKSGKTSPPPWGGSEFGPPQAPKNCVFVVNFQAKPLFFRACGAPKPTHV